MEVDIKKNKYINTGKGYSIMNEDILKNLLQSVKSGTPLDFSQTLDTALKYKCAEAIDGRKQELAGSFGLKTEDQGESMPPDDEKENFEGDPGDDKKDVDNEDDEYVNEEDDAVDKGEGGKAKKDYDGDGDVESKKDEYFGSRMKAAKKEDD